MLPNYVLLKKCYTPMIDISMCVLSDASSRFMPKNSLSFSINMMAHESILFREIDFSTLWINAWQRQCHESQTNSDEEAGKNLNCDALFARLQCIGAMLQNLLSYHVPPKPAQQLTPRFTNSFILLELSRALTFQTTGSRIDQEQLLRAHMLQVHFKILQKFLFSNAKSIYWPRMCTL